jgi:tRNA(adenine34) deaminase
VSENVHLKDIVQEAEMAATKTEAKKHVSRNKRWVARVTTNSTHPGPGLFTRKAPEIARSLASKKVSPKGAASGMRMLTYFINRGGKGLSKTRRAELEKAKKLLSERVQRGKKVSEGKAA